MCQQHPEINISLNKEPHYFSGNFHKGKAWYAGNWKEKKGLKGECSTTYLYSDEALERLQKEYPECRVMIILRHPLDRAVSHLNHVMRDRRFGSDKEVLTEKPEIVENSLYFERLKKVFSLFPREQILLLFFDELVQAPETLLQRAWHFLGVDEKEIPSHAEQVIGQGFTPKSRLAEKLRRSVYNVFKSFGFYRGIRWVKVSGLADRFRRWNSREKETQLVREEILLSFVPRFRQDIEKAVGLKDLTPDERDVLRQWSETF